VSPIAFQQTSMYENLLVTPDLTELLEKRQTSLRAATEARLAHEDVSWSYTRIDGDPARALVKHSRLADIIVLSRTASANDFNGPLSLAGALHAALPMLRLASATHVVTIGEADAPEFPATDACRFLSRHGIAREVRPFPKSARAIGPAILDTLGEIGAAYVVMGAYGHSRAREFLLGGATRHLLAHCAVPLMLAH